MAKLEVLVDSAVSRAKFKREIAAYRKLEKQFIQQGWWLVQAEFPTVFVVFGTPKLSPPAALFGVIIDFSNYDFVPPSVRIVNPFTQEAYTQMQLPTPLPRRVPGAAMLVPGPGGMTLQQPYQSLMQAHSGGEPFLCVPGVREYHQHPGHTGDSWWLHRGQGEGTLYFILNILYKYGVEPISEYAVELRSVVTGFQIGAVPE